MCVSFLLIIQYFAEFKPLFGELESAVFGAETDSRIAQAFLALRGLQ